MIRLVVDIETNGLLPDVSKVWCVSIMDYNTEELKSYRSDIAGDFKEAARRLNEADLIIGHNWAAYDAVVLERLWNNVVPFISSKVYDTMLGSCILNPDRFGGHGLASYGEEFGIAKPEHEDWTKLSDEMVHRNREDVKITAKVYNKLSNITFDNNFDIKAALQLEQQFSYIMSQQFINGWFIDQPAMEKLIEELEYKLAIEENYLNNNLPLNVIPGSTVRAYTKDGNLSVAAFKVYEDISLIAGDFCKVKFEKLNLNSYAQIKDYLYTIGWKPIEWNYKKNANGSFTYDKITGDKIQTTPKLCEDSLNKLKSDIGKHFHNRFIITKRLSFFLGESGIRYKIRSDGRVGAGCHPCATNTARVRHYGIANVCSVKKPYGVEVRSVFSVPKGKKLAGADLSALENRIAGHFTVPYDGGEYVKRLMEGDPHKHTADALGFAKMFNISDDEARSIGKVTNYSILYGAGSGKIRDNLGVTKEKAQEIIEGWWDATPALKCIKEDLHQQLLDKGFVGQYNKLKPGAWIPGLDGRPIFIRSSHSAINALFQSSGSICHKATVVLIYLMFKRDNINARIVGDFHDESQFEVDEDFSIDKFKEYFDKACELTTKRYKLNFALSGECKIGDNWFQTH